MGNYCTDLGAVLGPATVEMIVTNRAIIRRGSLEAWGCNHGETCFRDGVKVLNKPTLMGHLWTTSSMLVMGGCGCGVPLFEDLEFLVMKLSLEKSGRSEMLSDVVRMMVNSSVVNSSTRKCDPSPFYQTCSVESMPFFDSLGNVERIGRTVSLWHDSGCAHSWTTPLGPIEALNKILWERW